MERSMSFILLISRGHEKVERRRCDVALGPRMELPMRIWSLGKPVT